MNACGALWATISRIWTTEHLWNHSFISAIDAAATSHLLLTSGLQLYLFVKLLYTVYISTNSCFDQSVVGWREGTTCGRIRGSSKTALPGPQCCDQNLEANVLPDLSTRHVAPAWWSACRDWHRCPYGEQGVLQLYDCGSCLFLRCLFHLWLAFSKNRKFVCLLRIKIFFALWTDTHKL